jgi:cytochrome c oxidase assembly factor CtaG
MSGPMWMPMAPPDLARLFAWHPQPVPVLPLLCMLGLILYAAGVIRLHRNGVRWPAGRSISWVAGLASVVLVTGTGIGGYGMELFSVHMAQHMVLSMFSPIPLLMGAPLTLALRALPNGPGRRGLVRRTLLRTLHSRAARVLASPLLTVPLFLASLYGLYYTPLFDWGMGGFAGHTWMLIHFLGVGLLLFWPILAIDPSPHTSQPVIRILELFITAPFHAFFGIAVMSSTTLIAVVFAHPPAAWHVSALTDQHTGGAIAWGFSEAPTLLVVLAVAVLWARSSEREARRSDRRADRDGDRERTAYNEWLAALPGRAAGPEDRR